MPAAKLRVPAGPRPVTHTPGTPCQPENWEKLKNFVVSRKLSPVKLFGPSGRRTGPLLPFNDMKLEAHTHTLTHTLRGDTVSLFNSVKHGRVQQ